MPKVFWKDKKVLITGYEGFVGSHLTKKLLSLGADVFGIDIITERKETILTQKDLAQITIIKASVSEYKIVENIIKENKIQVVFHLAAEAIVGECLKKPLNAFSSNIKGTWNILEVCRQSDTVNCVITASSDKAYGEQQLPYKEDSPLKGQHPYDVSKSCADLLSQSYFQTYDLPVAITRCGNIYGPGDYNFSRIVPDAVRCAILSREFLIRSNGLFTRDYIFIDDIVEGYIMLAENLNRENLAGEAFNFSNEKPISVVELVEEIYRIAKQEPNYKILNEVKCEIKDQYLSSSKAKGILKWQPKYTLQDGLKKTILWYFKNVNK
ncbi:GDP-mannose 4,6-dehydratase [bacterium]|nr:GDP-mannose 4,6-dehydratase [bacterium]